LALHPEGQSAKVYARTAGVLYLVIIACALFSEVAVRSGLVVPGDAMATAGNISRSELLFRIGFVSDVVAFVSDVVVAVLLYVLLRPVSRVLSLTAAGFRLTGTAIYGVNLLNHLAPLLLLGRSSYLGAFEPGQAEALALFFLELHGNGYDLGLIFFGFHCLAVGYLLYKSDFFPKVLGVLMVLAGAAYLLGSGTLFLFPDRADAVAFVYAAPLIGALALGLWLVGRGIRAP